MNSQELMQRQVERRLKEWYDLEKRPPPQGWLATIRKALGMSGVQLSERLGITRQGVASVEARERDGSATISALRKAAEGMQCDLVYAIVPRIRLSDLITQEAERKARAEMRRVAHTMRLEAQGTSSEEVERLIRDRIEQLLRSKRRELWTRGEDRGHAAGQVKEKNRGRRA
jgi:predicted DNA-binding mobile mystery protein A